MKTNPFLQYCRQIAEFPPLPPDKAKDILRQAQAGDEKSIEAVVKSHLKLVVSIIRKYRWKGVDPLDLVGEGNLAIYKALASYDLAKNTEFSTWAYYKILRAIQVFLGDQSYDFRVPKEWVRHMGLVSETIKSFVAMHGRDPTYNEISELTGIPPQTIERMYPVAIRKIQEVSSRNATGEGLSYEEKIPQRSIRNPDDALMDKDRREHLRETVDLLDPRTAQVIRMFYGIGGPQMNKSDIAKELQLSSRYIAKILEKGLAELTEHLANATF